MTCFAIRGDFKCLKLGILSHLGLAQKHPFHHLFRCISQEPVLRKWVVCFPNIFAVYISFWSLWAPRRVSDGSFWHLFSPFPTWNMPLPLFSDCFESWIQVILIILPRIWSLWFQAFLTPDLLCFMTMCHLQRYLCPSSLSPSLGVRPQDWRPHLQEIPWSKIKVHECGV